ncbi:MAG: EpsG family protein [Clostridiales bacterium]|jgi:hypothetical protein|nr:EpsG family protein [Clostridiales bacterium]
MTVYYALLIGAVVVGFPLCKNQKPLYVKIYLSLVFAAFFAAAAVRNISGYDYNLYAGWYNELVFKNYDWLMSWSREKGFAVPFKILTVVTQHYQWMFVYIALVISVGVTLYIYKFSSKAYVSVALFISFGLYYNTLNFMRQFIAAIVCSFALSYIQSKQPLRFLVLVFFASCFHYSALLLIPFYLILKIKLNWVVLALYCVIAAVTYIYSNPIVEYVTEYFYKGYDPLESVHMLSGIPVRYVVFFAVLFAVCFFFRKELVKKRELNSVMLSAFFFCVYFQFLGTKHSILSRFSLLFMIAPVIVLLPDVITVIMDKITEKFGEEKKSKVYKALVISAFSVYSLVVHALLLANNYNGVVPYQTIFANSGL